VQKKSEEWRKSGILDEPSNILGTIAFTENRKKIVGGKSRDESIAAQFIFESYGWIVSKKLSKIPSNIRIFAHNFVIFCQVGNRKKLSVANHESCPNPLSDYVSAKNTALTRHHYKQDFLNI